MGPAARAARAKDRLSNAVVIKGPLLPFTRSLLTFYLERLFLEHSGDTGVVFSHNNASACSDTIDFLEQLGAAHPRNFAWVLAPAPPKQGYGYRNTQREAVANGISLAVQRWQVNFLLVQRPDSAFQHAETLTGMTTLMHSLPPPLVGGRAWGRIGFCPFQTQLTDAYGLFHLDVCPCHAVLHNLLCACCLKPCACSLAKNR